MLNILLLSSRERERENARKKKKKTQFIAARLHSRTLECPAGCSVGSRLSLLVITKQDEDDDAGVSGRVGGERSVSVNRLSTVETSREEISLIIP